MLITKSGRKTNVFIYTVTPRTDADGEANVTITIEWMNQRMVITPESTDEAETITSDLDALSEEIDLVMEEQS